MGYSPWICSGVESSLKPRMRRSSVWYFMVRSASYSNIGHLTPGVARRAQQFDEMLYPRMLHFHGRLVNNQARADVGDVFKRRQTIGFQRIARVHQIDDAIS